MIKDRGNLSILVHLNAYADDKGNILINPMLIFAYHDIKNNKYDPFIGTNRMIKSLKNMQTDVRFQMNNTSNEQEVIYNSLAQMLKDGKEGIAGYLNYLVPNRSNDHFGNFNKSESFNITYSDMFNLAESFMGTLSYLNVHRFIKPEQKTKEQFYVLSENAWGDGVTINPVAKLNALP